ncbi:hypothetical protein HBN50_17430 [Halobacteriovorax sp. GB3]|uniref:hypothetical protein n=1 Tax=Halobacteriovorax sp. GB3 TaxID=2719615 RepID=UPI00235DC513|nr:hypothetical protein [Halobacteriovorax sp. GB3]MDD0854886.1 hypothetical protein [Halobacteriovorax sp. GB3]
MNESTSYLNPNYQSAVILEDYVSNLTKVKREDLKKGDLIYFEEHSKSRYTENGKNYYRNLPPRPAHSATYIGNGFILQKENVFNKIFSLAPLSSSIHAYEKGLNSRPQIKRGTIKMRYFRAKN